MRGRFHIGFGLIVGGLLGLVACDEVGGGQFCIAVGAGLMTFELLWQPHRENRP